MHGFVHLAVPILVVFDEGADFKQPPPGGFDTNMLPVIARSLKQQLGEDAECTVIAGQPVNPESLPASFTFLSLQYPSLKKTDPKAANLIIAEFINDHFDAEDVLAHLTKLVGPPEPEPQVSVVPRGEEHAAAEPTTEGQNAEGSSI